MSEMWTYVIDGPKAKLKLTVYTPMSAAEWEQMFGALAALKEANVYLPTEGASEPVLTPEESDVLRARKRLEQ